MTNAGEHRLLRPLHKTPTEIVIKPLNNNTQWCMEKIRALQNPKKAQKQLIIYLFLICDASIKKLITAFVLKPSLL